MSLYPVLGALLGALVGGAVAWRRVTATLYYRSYNPTIRPEHVAPEDYDAWMLGRRKRVRLLKVATAALAGAVAGGVLVVMMGAGLARK